MPPVFSLQVSTIFNFAFKDHCPSSVQFLATLRLFLLVEKPWRLVVVLTWSNKLEWSALAVDAIARGEKMLVLQEQRGWDGVISTRAKRRRKYVSGLWSGSKHDPSARLACSINELETYMPCVWMRYGCPGPRSTPGEKWWLSCTSLAYSPGNSLRCDQGRTDIFYPPFLRTGFTKGRWDQLLCKGILDNEEMNAALHDEQGIHRPWVLRKFSAILLLLMLLKIYFTFFGFEFQVTHENVTGRSWA